MFVNKYRVEFQKSRIQVQLRCNNISILPFFTAIKSDFYSRIMQSADKLCLADDHLKRFLAHNLNYKYRCLIFLPASHTVFFERYEYIQRANFATAPLLIFRMVVKFTSKVSCWLYNKRQVMYWKL